MGFQFNHGDRPLAGYTIQRGVGRGGFGEVYYALSDGGKEVALKYLRENPQVELRGVAHCLNLKSPYLVDLHDVKQNAEGDHFVVMEYVSGPSLRDLMNAEPSGLGAQKAAYFLREICKGLAYLHDRGIVHRDLKPGNIFYEDGYVKIGDYGLAKIMAASQHSGQTVSVGTVHYMAPEVGSGNYDRTIDIYALGVILYEMLLGRVPFSGATMGEVLMKHLTAQPAVDDLPEPFPQVIRKALAKDPKDRYQTVNEMLSELFAVEDLDRSVAAFEPASLSAVAERAAAHVKVAQAVVHPAGAGPLGTGSSNVGQNVPPPVLEPPFAPGGSAGRLEQIHDRISAQVGRVADRIDSSLIGRQVAEAGRKPAHRAERILVALMISAAMAFGISLLAEGGAPEYAVTVFLHIMVVVPGIVLGGWLSLDRLRTDGKWLPRFIIMACVGAGLVPIRLFSEYALDIHDVAGWAPALLVSMVMCDWIRRFRDGQRGRVHLGSAFSAGLFGFLAGLILDTNAGFTIGGILAASSLALQSVAGLWPKVAMAGGPHGASAEEARHARRDGRHGSPPRHAEGAVAAHVQPAKPGPQAQDAPGAVARAGVELVRRSAAVRTLWLVLAAALMLGLVMQFIAAGVLDNGPDDFGLWIIGGIVTSNCFLLALWCALPRYKKGLWRGVFRKVVFFTGTAIAGASGASIGLFNPTGDSLVALLGAVIAGGITSLFVWFIPVAPYVPRQAVPSTGQDAERVGHGKRLMKIGGILLGVLTVVLVPVLVWLDEDPSFDEDLIPVILVPLYGFAATILIVGAGIVRSHSKSQARASKLSLPLRSVFDVDAHPNLPQLIERHLTMLGYTLDKKSDNLWSFVRGNWVGQFWQSNIRQWGIRLNIAAYELDHGGRRLSCFVDVQSAFNDPKQQQLAVLEEELRDLKELLGGRDTSSARLEEAQA